MSTGEFYIRAPLPDGMDPGDPQTAARAARRIAGLFGDRLDAALLVEVDPEGGYVTVSTGPEPGEVLKSVLRELEPPGYGLEDDAGYWYREPSPAERAAVTVADVLRIAGHHFGAELVITEDGQPGLARIVARHGWGRGAVS